MNADNSIPPDQKPNVLTVQGLIDLVRAKSDEMMAGLPAYYKDLKPGLHPADQFDQMSALGWKLDLITGEYYR